MRTWKCQRQSAGVKCGTNNPRVKQKCIKCGKPRPKKKVPAHKAILSEMAYEMWVEAYGEQCGICGRKPTTHRRLDRDHDHKTGKARGLLCARCNRALPAWMTAEWLTKAAEYLKNQPS